MAHGLGGGEGVDEWDEGRERDLQTAYREKLKAYATLEGSLRATKSLQRIYLLGVAGGICLTLLLGYTVIVGLWNSDSPVVKLAGIAIVNLLWIGSAVALFQNHRQVVEKTTELRNALQRRQTAAAALPLDSPSGLRIYREASLDLVENFRRRAGSNRRVHNLFQLVIISGSIITSTLTAMNAGENFPLSIATSTLSALVGISAGVTGYFKFRERGYNLQSTADEIEKHYNSSQFMLDEYGTADRSNPLPEAERLRKFAGFVERIKEEQRKRELQLESSSASEERAG